MQFAPTVSRHRTQRFPGQGNRRKALLLATTALGTSLAIGSAQAQNLPTGGSVAAGTVSVAVPTPTQMNITQTSQSAVVNWQSFSVGQGYGVNIQQPNSASALLNRVTGNAPSTIAGSLTANGHVYLVNPNGIAITRTGVVNTGGFVASTLGISDSDFMSGKRTFAGTGASAGVSNAGTVTTGRGGYAALIGGTVENTGNIVVPFGKVALGSGERVTLDFAGDGFLQVAVPTTSGGSDALIRNSGTIRADGGSMIISAATARDAARNAVNISGVVQARTIGGRTGSIVIGGGNGGAVKITGQLTATASKTTGGAITVTGEHIELEGATINVTGRTGGGTINIGGGRQGEGPLQHADTLAVDVTTTIRADAKVSGNGGDIVLWSDQLTTFAGTITARGGFLSGNGGEAEVSGKAKLGYTGFTDLSATNGKFGTLLLDPYNVTIATFTNNPGGGFTASSNDSLIDAATLQTALGSANVTVTTGAGGAQAGNITVAAPLTWAAATTLTLTAANAVAINAPIRITGAGGLAVNAVAQAGITTTGLTFGNGASVTYGADAGGGIIAGQSFSLNGLGYTLVYSMAHLDAIDGFRATDSAVLTPYGTGAAGYYALATNFTATDVYTRSLLTSLSGRLDGLGHTITSLTINAPTTNVANAENVGLVGFLTGSSSVSNIGLIGANVTGRSFVGALVGYIQGGTVQGSYTTGAVTGVNSSSGGLVGRINLSNSVVQASYSTATVKGNNRNGGLVGYNSGGVVRNSYATGAVSGKDNTGGLVGMNSNTGTIQTSYATGAVSGNGIINGMGGATRATNAGGLVGFNEIGSTVQASYATGMVSGNDITVGGVTAFAINTGGLIGENGGTVSSSYWDTQTSGRASGIGLDTNSQQGNVSGRTTAQLQGVLPAGFNPATWSTGPGRYPYLNWQVAAPAPVAPPSPAPGSAPATEETPPPSPGDANPGLNSSVGSQAGRTTMSFQLDQSGTGSITPLIPTPNRIASTPSQPTQTTEATPTPQQTAATQNADDDIVTGSVGPQAIKSADGFIYRPLSQYDAAQYSGNTLPGYEGQTGEATIMAMLLRGGLGSHDAPKIDQLFEPGKGLQWKGVNWGNPLADKVGFSDGAGRAGTPGESFPIQAGATDFAALLGKGVLVLTGSSGGPNATSLLGVAMTQHGIVANDPATGHQVLLIYNLETKTLGAISSVRDSKTGTWTKLVDAKPTEGGLTQAQFDQFAKLSIDRFAAVSVPAAGPR